MLAPYVAVLLQLRGAALPSLRWHDKPNQAAKQVLQDIEDDARLFRQTTLADEPMVGAVRAMLYLWNGWPSECKMYAQGAPEKERNYLLGICARQAGHADEAKCLFQQVPEHVIYSQLASFALETIGPGSGAMVQRYRSILEQDGRWETCAFVDIYEQALAEKLDPVGERVVRTLQCREFELLFKYCYQEATGELLCEDTEEESIDMAAVARLRERRKAGRRRHRVPAPQRKPSAAPEAKEDGPPPSIAVLCPKCETKVTLPASARGSMWTCEQCGARFLIPHKRPPQSASPAATDGAKPAHREWH